MSFQAYLDNIEEKTGKTPNDFIAMAKEKGFDSPKTKAGDIIAQLKEDYGLGRGHAMAIVQIIKNGAEIGDKHVGSDGVHRDESNVLRLDGKKKEQKDVQLFHQRQMWFFARLNYHVNSK